MNTPAIIQRQLKLTSARPDRGCAPRFCVTYRSTTLICWEKKLLRKRQRIWPHICDSSRPLLQLLLPPTLSECHIAFYSRNLFHFCPNPPFPATTLSLPLLPIPFSLHDDDDDDDDVGHMNGQNGCQKRGCGGGGRTGSTQCENECVARLLLILRLAAGTPPVSATLFYTSSLLFCESRERTLWGI